LGGFRPDRGRVNVGVGFAASIDQIKNFLLDLRAGQQCQHGTMNATVRDVAGDDGAYVEIDQIYRECKAFKAGVRLGDVVRAFNGVSVSTQNELLMLISRLPSGRRVTITIERRREDGEGFHEPQDIAFRLEPLWSGPQQGQWACDPKLVEAETEIVLAAHRGLPRASDFVREERVLLPDGSTELRVLRVKGSWVRLETGPPGRQPVEVVAERSFLITPEGAVERLPSARRDALAGTAQALAGLGSAAAQAELKHLLFTGGEFLGGRQVIRLESRDAAGRARMLYLDIESHDLAGLAYPTTVDDTEVWVEEVHMPRDGGYRVIRADFETGAVLERSEADVRAEAQDAALFTRPADEEEGQ
ncbi:S1C family serine protease, partial [Planctomycetota bacterium]|nr:S1C family serine protease [Planctomycetota bacterium]